MAQRGGSAARRTENQDVKNTIAFQSAQLPDIRFAANNNGFSPAANDNDLPLAANDNGDSSRLTDSSNLDVTERSPIQLPERSYTQEQDTETEFGEQISTLAEMEEQRARETKMRETAEQFVGAPTQPGALARGPAQRRGGGKQKTTEGFEQGGEESPSEEAPESATEIIQSLMEDQTRENLLRRNTLASTAQQTSTQEAEMRRKQMQQTWRFVNGTEAMFAETIVPLIFLMFTWNLQLANKVSFRNFDMIPDLSAPEAATVIFFNCGCCYNCLISILMTIIPLLPIVILMVIALKAVDSVGGVLGFLFK